MPQVVAEKCNKCNGYGCSQCSGCKGRGWLECKICNGTGRIQEKGKASPQITAQLLKKLDDFSREIKDSEEGNLSFPMLILDPETGEPKSINELLPKNEECVFHDGKWTNIADKEGKIGKQIPQDSFATQKLRTEAVPLEKMIWLNELNTESSFFNMLSGFSLVYKTTFYPLLKGQDNYTFFYKNGDDLSFGFVSKKCDKLFYLEILGTDNIHIKGLQRLLSSPDAKLVLYYRIKGIKWDKQEKGSLLKTTGSVETEIIAWEVANGGKNTIAYVEEKK